MLVEKTYSDSYKQLILALHEGPEYGKREGPYVYQLANGGQRMIANNIIPMNPATILDYGCGQNGNNLEYVKKLVPAVTITKYDPFVPAFNNFPAEGSKFDVVVAFDVLNDVEYEYLETILNNFVELTNNYVVLSFAIVPYRVTEAHYMSLINARFDIEFEYTTGSFTTNEGDQATRKILVLTKKA